MAMWSQGQLVLKLVEDVEDGSGIETVNRGVDSIRARHCGSMLRKNWCLRKRLVWKQRNCFRDGS